jgi:hypothetical protein
MVRDGGKTLGLSQEISPNCPIIKSAGGHMEKILSKKQILELKGVFKCIEKEDSPYKKQKARLGELLTNPDSI